MEPESKTKACKMCGKEFTKDKLSSKGFCDKCIIQRYINYHEKALEHYLKLREEQVEEKISVQTRAT